MVYLPHWPIANRDVNQTERFVILNKILNNLGNPHLKIPPVIHVAGTNGKGSTIAFLSAIFKAANYKTHIYTSPHLHHVNERIVIANKQVSDRQLFSLLEEVRFACEGENLTLFEGLTLAAILAFSQNPADVCLIECGMGGRIDATNIIPEKILTILTSISLDHMQFLGPNLDSIAFEKSQIMRNGIPTILANQEKEAGMRVEIEALKIGSPLINEENDFRLELKENGNFDFYYKGKNFETSYLNLPAPALLGFHQYQNAALAIAGICTILDFQKANFNIEAEHIAAGLTEVKWPARLEKIDKISSKNCEIWFDGAHNVGGAESLANWLLEKKLQEPEKANYLVSGFTKGKAQSQFFEFFKDIVDFACAVRVKSEPNPEEPKIIGEEISKIGISHLAFEDLEEALNFLQKLQPEKACNIVICGSLYLFCYL